MPNNRFDRDVFDQHLKDLDALFKDCGLDVGAAAIQGAVTYTEALQAPEPSAEAVAVFSKRLFPAPLLAERAITNAA